MAHLTGDELTTAVTLLSEHFGFERLRDRLARMNAFTSRRGLNSPAALAGRLHLLTGGLRRQVTATYAFSAVWSEMVQARVGEAGERRLEALAEQVNACLTPEETVILGKEEDIDRALASYRQELAAGAGETVALLDMLLKAVPAVAARLRARVGEPPGASTEPPG
jgi:hypothetical protein